MSTRRGTWVLNRVGDNGWPADMVLVNQTMATVQKCCPQFVNWFMEREVNKKFDHETYGLKPTHRLLGEWEFYLLPLSIEPWHSSVARLEQHPFINDDLANRILCGSVIVKPNVREFAADGHSVVFEDGSTVNQLDCVLMATGFTVAFPYLSEEIISVNENRVSIIDQCPEKEQRRSLIAGSTVQICLATTSEAWNIGGHGSHSAVGCHQSDHRTASALGCRSIQRCTETASPSEYGRRYWSKDWSNGQAIRRFPSAHSSSRSCRLLQWTSWPNRLSAEPMWDHSQHFYLHSSHSLLSTLPDQWLPTGPSTSPRWIYSLSISLRRSE